MSDAASERRLEHQREIAAYVAAVLESGGWKQQALAQRSGVKQHTISRALNGEHKTEFEALLAIEQATGVAIPESLWRTARRIYMPDNVEPQRLSPKVQEIIDMVSQRPDDERRELVNALLGGVRT